MFALQNTQNLSWRGRWFYKTPAINQTLPTAPVHRDCVGPCLALLFSSQNQQLFTLKTHFSFSRSLNKLRLIKSPAKGTRCVTQTSASTAMIPPPNSFQIFSVISISKKEIGALYLTHDCTTFPWQQALPARSRWE